MANWRVSLDGDRFDLEELPALFAEPSLRVQQEGESFFLESTALASLEDAPAVRRAAEDLVSAMNGAARLIFPNFRPVNLGSAVTRTDQGQALSIFLASGGLEIRSKASTALLVDGRPAPPSPSPAAPWARTAQRDSAALRVFRFLGKPSVDWNDLYRVHEILQANEGSTALTVAGISGGEVDRFTQTANSWRALGDDARHAKDTVPAPATPMTLDEARSMIHAWVRAWLDIRK